MADDDLGKGCKMQMQASCKHQVLSKPGENKIELFYEKKVEKMEGKCYKLSRL